MGRKLAVGIGVGTALLIITFIFLVGIFAYSTADGVAVDDNYLPIEFTDVHVEVTVVNYYQNWKKTNQVGIQIEFERAFDYRVYLDGELYQRVNIHDYPYDEPFLIIWEKDYEGVTTNPDLVLKIYDTTYWTLEEHALNWELIEVVD